MKANRTLLQMKYARIISEFAKKSGLSTKEAMDFFYHSKEYELYYAPGHLPGAFYFYNKIGSDFSCSYVSYIEIYFFPGINDKLLVGNCRFEVKICLHLTIYS